MNSEVSAKEQRKAKKRETIIEGAIKAFQQEGYERASMDLVAKLGKVSKRTVYNHFKSKKDLVWAVIEQLMTGQNDLIQITYSKNESLESQLAKFFDAQVYFVMAPDRLEIVRLLTSIFVKNRELCEEAAKSGNSQFDQLIEWLNAAKKDRRLMFKDSVITAQIFRGLVEGTINFPALYSSYKTTNELKPLKEEVIAVFLSRYTKLQY